MQEQRSKTLGFTLLELMITITIAAILVGIAVPNFMSVIQSNRLTTSANAFVTAMNLARSEAIKRGQIVVVREIGSDWKNGWQVFVDIDRASPSSDADTYQAGANSTLCESGEDCLLREFPALPTSYTLDGSGNVSNYLSFMPAGDANTQGSFVICDNSDNNNLPEAGSSRLIVVNATGRLRIAEDSDNPKDGIPNTGSAGPNLTTCLPP
ncbi:GspH/FimT family pseudopilin [Methyloglobulus morosus]|nr:GspH/FimT family pseudopilin [Methyloglobulus morosus]